MLRDSHAFSSFSVDDISAARAFYAGVLGLDVTEEMGALTIRFPNGGMVFAYPKGSAHESASFTVLNFPVADIDATVSALKDKGVRFEHHQTETGETGDDGIARGQPTMAWFKDPAGNILSLLKDEKAG